MFKQSIGFKETQKSNFNINDKDEEDSFTNWSRKVIKPRTNSLLGRNKSELDKSVMAWVGSPAQSQMSLFLEYPFPQKSVVMSLKKNDRSSHAWHGFFWLVKNWRPFVCCARRAYLKINPFVIVLGQGRKVIDQHSNVIHCNVLIGRLQIKLNKTFCFFMTVENRRARTKPLGGKGRRKNKAYPHTA